MNEIRQSLGGELDDHPTYEMIEQVVDGAADDVTREIVESHAEVCPTCAAELRDLGEFAHAPQPKSFPLRWLVAAALLVVAIGIAIVIATQRDSDIDAKPVRRAVIMSGYGRADWDHAVRDALSGARIERPAILRDLRPPAQVLRGTDPASHTAMSPAGIVIETTAPVFTWTAKPGRYVVSIYDGVERVAQSGVLRTPEWRMTSPLRRGRTYTWQVEVRGRNGVEIIPAPPASPALFHVLDEQDATTLAEARRQFPGDHLLQGVLYARMGLQQQAVGELRQYAALHPEARALAESVARW
jgi:hypothetical protein